MKKTNLILATILATFVGFGSGSAMAEGSGDGERSWKHQSGKHHGGKRGGRHGGGKHMMKRMAKKLNLTEDQKAQMKTMRETQKADNQVLRDEMKELRKDMQALDRNDLSAVEAMAARKGTLEQKRFIAKNAARLAFESILTDVQKAKLKEMKEKRQARKAERMKKRMERKAAKEANAT